MAIWDDLLSAQDRQVFEAYMGNATRELGKRPAIVVVDVNYAFVGLKPEPILESIKTFRTSCGDVGWAVIPRLQALIALGRELGIPIVYSTTRTDQMRGAGWANRSRDNSGNEVLSHNELEKRTLGNTIVKEIEPQARDIVVEKRAPSAFYGTSLLSYLNELDIDTLLVTGTTTSGCVRATAVDGASNRFYVGIIEDCTFDRVEISHKVSLLDMNAKYGTVISLGEAMEYLKAEANPTLST
jgi:maleamate amidohydrolase